MLEILQQIISILTADTTLTAIVPATNIMTGPVDVTMESQASLLYPSINLSIISESVRSVPSNTRDTHIQLDIFSRNSQLELETIYEQVLLDLNYLTVNQSTAHIYWQVLRGAVDAYESDRRYWHKVCTFILWSIKPK